MSTKRLQITSIICLFLSVGIELADKQGWLNFGNPELPWGISLGLILAALSFNIKVIRDFGASPKARKSSQRFALVIAIYAFAVFALEVI
jgi:hypothetical protein